MCENIKNVEKNLKNNEKRLEKQVVCGIFISVTGESPQKKKRKGNKMNEIILTWDDVVNRYDDDQQAFEEYFCDQLGIELAGCDELNERFAGSKFAIRPNYDYIRWRGVINSDFRVREVCNG